MKTTPVECSGYELEGVTDQSPQSVAGPVVAVEHAGGSFPKTLVPHCPTCAGPAAQGMPCPICAGIERIREGSRRMRARFNLSITEVRCPHND